SRARDKAQEELTEKRWLRWAEELIHHTEGFTVGNINHLLIAAQIKLDPDSDPVLAAMFDDVDGRKEVDLGKHPALAVLLLKVCRQADFNSPIEQAARDAAELYAEELRGKESA